MPELPEVETIKNDLLPQVVGRRFVAVNLISPEVVKSLPATEFSQKLRGQKVVGLRRRGKYLLFELESGRTLVIHLKMTGALLLDGESPYCRAVFHLDDGRRLAFVDRRKLGRLWLADDAGRVVAGLGPEPLDEDFTPAVFAHRLKKHRVPIKALLLDQSFLAGLGNMYADEALFLARIHPLTSARELTAAQVEALYGAIRQILRQAIQSLGASVDTYLRPDGSPGSAHLGFKVAHRGKQPCPNCGTPIERLALRGRGTYFCPRCQSGG